MPPDRERGPARHRPPTTDPHPAATTGEFDGDGSDRPPSAGATVADWLGAEAEAWLAAHHATWSASAVVDGYETGQLTMAELLDGLADVGLWAIRARRHGWSWQDERIGAER
jgi:hypothetical protein